MVGPIPRDCQGSGVNRLRAVLSLRFILHPVVLSWLAALAIIYR